MVLPQVRSSIEIIGERSVDLSAGMCFVAERELGMRWVLGVWRSSRRKVCGAVKGRGVK